MNKLLQYFKNLSTKGKLVLAGITLLSFVLLAIFGLVGFYYSVSWGFFGKLPSDQELISIKNFEASEVYSSDGVLIGRYFLENRSDVQYEDIAPHIIQALIATEDARFYSHEGVDHYSMMRVLFKSVILGQHKGGGSTITQQLIKNLFGRNQKGFLAMPVTKIKEAILANKFEHLYSKEEILVLYLNTVSFGEDTYGIQTACERFFSSNTKEISVDQAAVLIGMLKAPTTYNPRLNPENALKRRNIVLYQMHKENYLSQEKYDQYKQKELILNYQKSIQTNGYAGYFTEFVRKIAEKQLKEQGDTYNLYTDGLKIHTTIHSKIQHYAEEAVNAHLSHLQTVLYRDLTNTGKFKINHPIMRKYIQQSTRYKNGLAAGKSEKEMIDVLKTPVNTQLFTYRGEKDTLISPLDSIKHSISILQAGCLLIDPQTGDVLAWVGGASFEQYQYDHVLSKRQVGSVFKPIVYAKAMIDGKEPCDFIKNQKVSYTRYDNWTPQNSDHYYGGEYSLIGALTNSVNTISVKLCMESGIDHVIDFSKTLGITDSLPKVPSLALGSADLPLHDMIQAYTAFANQGKKATPRYITKITDKEGTTIYESQEIVSEVIDAKIANQITAMLTNVVEHGTAARLRTSYGIKGAIAGKTGTTQHQTDGWFIGYTPHWLGGVWVGADNPAIRFSTIKDGQGANTALPIWASIYKAMDKDPALKKMNQHRFKEINHYDCEAYRDITGIRKLFTKKEKVNRQKGYQDDSYIGKKSRSIFKRKEK